MMPALVIGHTGDAVPADLDAWAGARVG